MDVEIALFWSGMPGVIFAGVLGALFGSFANVCIYRMPPSEKFPKGRSVIHPPSHCFVCGVDVKWYDNTPLLSWLWLKGKCRNCKTEFSPRYLLVEGLAALLWAALFYRFVTLESLTGVETFFPNLIRFAVYAFFVFWLLVITFIDIDHKLILNKVTYPMIPILWGLSVWPLGQSPWDGLIGLCIGYLIVRAISDGYYLLTKKEGMGYGDGKLLAMIGALLGKFAPVFCIFAGSMLGSVFGIAILMSQRKKAAKGENENAIRHVQIPFGPYLAAAALIYLFCGTWLTVKIRLFYGL